MAREEEINYASKDYVNYLLDKQEYHNEDYTEDDIRQAFEKGAMFADKNPPQDIVNLNKVWHDANIVPSENKGIIYLTKNNKLGVFNSIKSNNWDWYVSGKYSIIKWAYSTDLLPKQFGNTK